MHRLLALLSAALIAFPLVSQAQTPVASAPPAAQAPAPVAQVAAQQAGAAPPGATVLQTGTQLVIVDVVVQDRDGKPVRQLPRDSFRLLEDKQPQAMRHFEEHSATDRPPAGPTLPPMAPGTFTDYTPTPPNGTLNILLLDSLNTPMKDQAYVRYQLQQYVKTAKPGTDVAIFGLSSKLYLLQGFTSNLDTLKNAVEHRLIPRASSLLDDPVGTNSDGPSTIDDLSSGPGMDQVSANLAQFEAETQAFQLQLRIQYTLDAFNALAHYLANYPGRKNLIWFSGSFPLNILPDPTLQNPFVVAQVNEDEYRETTNLLTRAQVAVYPVDARGLMTNPVFDAANSGRSYARNPSAVATATQKFSASQAAEHTTMEQLAEDTGGHAFYNTNGLADAVTKALDAGSNYYTLAYSPTNHNWNGSFRNIRIELTPEAINHGYTLSYRHGYYADDPYNPKKGSQTASVTEGALAATNSADTYARLAMSRGAPTPEDILFKVRVLPHSTGTEETLTKDDAVDPRKPIKPPFRRYDVDYAAVTRDFSFKTEPNGLHTDTVEFKVFVYDADGTLLNVVAKAIQISLKTETYEQFMKQAAAAHLEVSVPAKGESFLRIAIHDLNSNHFGVVEIPTSQVARLAPPAPPPAAATPPASSTAPPAASTVPKE